MDHLAVVSNPLNSVSNEFNIRASGRYYTNKIIAEKLISVLLEKHSEFPNKTIKVIDPFAGDGRLIVWFIEAWLQAGLRDVVWELYLFDINLEGFQGLKNIFKKLTSKGVNLKYKTMVGDSFRITENYKNDFDIVITNPPWEMLKPDKKELEELNEVLTNTYINTMKSYDVFLAEKYPLSQPLRKFAGWGTNLSRVGAELSFNLCKCNGYCAIVLPASFFADDQSLNIRKQFILNGDMHEVSYFPAEAKLFGKADISSSTLVYKRTNKLSKNPQITVYDKDLKIKTSETIDVKSIQGNGFVMPITLGGGAIKLLDKIQRNHISWAEVEKVNEIWAGREIDETNSKEWLAKEGHGPKFFKGKMINRFHILEEPTYYINKIKWKVPESSKFYRIVWRDVSRPSQKRRIIATVIPGNTIAGNSLGVVYYKNNDIGSLYGLLGVMNSLCFEFQLKCYLATSHISLSALRKACIPKQDSWVKFNELIELVRQQLESNEDNQPKMEVIVARDIYKLSKKEFMVVLNTFDKLTHIEKKDIINEY